MRSQPYFSTCGHMVLYLHMFIYGIITDVCTCILHLHMHIYGIFTSVYMHILYLHRHIYCYVYTYAKTGMITGLFSSLFPLFNKTPFCLTVRYDIGRMSSTTIGLFKNIPYHEISGLIKNMSRTVGERKRAIETKSVKDLSPTQPQHILLPRLPPRCAPPPCPHKPCTAHAQPRCPKSRLFGGSGGGGSIQDFRRSVKARLNRVLSARQAEEVAFETSGALDDARGRLMLVPI
jgi:hypothetical protein